MDELGRVSSGGDGGRLTNGTGVMAVDLTLDGETEKDVGVVVGGGNNKNAGDGTG